jgi:hypothetical protein
VVIPPTQRPTDGARSEGEEENGGKWELVSIRPGERGDGNLGREKLFIFIRNLKNGCF